MKKILLILLFVCTFIKADGVNSYNEYKIDLYYANSIMMQDSEVESQVIWEVRSDDLLTKYSILKPRINQKYVAYNISHGMVSDLWESFFQKVSTEADYSVSWTAFKRFVARIPRAGKAADFLAKANEVASGIIRDNTLDKQYEQYQRSIEQGHGVVTVAHSQGNLFTSEAFLRLKPWMKPYFHTIAVATPSSKIPNNGKGVTFYNDIINLVPGAMDNKIDNPNKYDYYPKNALDETLELLTDQKSAQYHEFKYYLGYSVYEEALKVGSSDVTSIEKRQTDSAKDIILQLLYDEIVEHHTRDSQWKITDKIDKDTKDYHVTLTHEGDSSLDVLISRQKIFPFNVDMINAKTKLYQLLTGEWVIASFNGEKILDADYNEWENKKENQFYKLQGTNPTEYIEKEETCKDSSIFKILSQENKNTENWRVTVKNKETNETQSDVYPFNLEGSLYQLENSGDWVIASCGGTEILSVWDNQEDNEFYKLTDTDDIIRIRFERDDLTDIVTDHEKKRQWQDTAITWLDSWYGANRHCTNLTLGGHEDWRVPTYDELIHIINVDGPTYRYEIFEHLGPVGYWTTQRQGIFPSTEVARVVNFGLSTWIDIGTSYHMNTRCVRTK